MHYRVTHAITRMTNVKFFTQLFGNSSFIVYYLRRLGYHLVQSASRPGPTSVTRWPTTTPYLCSVGRGTVIADGLSMINAEYSSTSLRAVSGVHRTAQLPGKQHRLSAAGQDRRQLSAGNESHGSAGRTDPRRSRAARLAGFRDPSFGRAGQPIRPPPHRRGPSTQSGREESLQPADHGCVPVRALAAPLPGHPARHGRGRSVRSAGPCRGRCVLRPQCPAQRGVLHSGRTLLHGIPAAEAAAVLLLRAVLLVARTTVEGAGRHLSQRLQRHPLQESDLALAGCPARAAGSSTTGAI